MKPKAMVFMKELLTFEVDLMARAQDIPRKKTHVGITEEMAVIRHFDEVTVSPGVLIQGFQTLQEVTVDRKSEFRRKIEKDEGTNCRFPICHCQLSWDL